MPDSLTEKIGTAVDERMGAARTRAQALVEEHAEHILAFARLLVAAPNRRLSDEALDAAMRSILPAMPERPTGV
jgi:hypothetical protein